MKRYVQCPQCDHQFAPHGDESSSSPPPDEVIGIEANALSGRRGASRSSRARQIRWAVAGAALLACVGFAVMMANRPVKSSSKAVVLPTSLGEQAGSTTDSAPQQPSADSPPVSNETSDIASRLPSLERAVVRIEALGPGEATTLGSGFVIDSHGLVATNYHVMAEATEARARFKDGAAYDIAGYVALQPDEDLAIVKLKSPPPNLAAMQLRRDDDPAQLATVVAIGHPHGVEFSPVDGKVSRVLRTSELPSNSRAFLRSLMSGDHEHRWIQHTAPISSGNSGGPLLNERGEVVGINTWVDRQTSFGYALHAGHLARLRDDTSDEIAPLARYARKEARVAKLLSELSTARIEQLFDEAKAMEWRPSTAADYEKLQHLAWAVSVANLPNALVGPGGLDDARLAELLRTSDQIVERLRKEKWSGPGQVLLVNEQAVEQIDEPMAGLFFFGSVERVVTGPDGTRGILMELAGMDRELFLPIEGQLVVPEAGEQCLVLGVNYDGHIVRYGDNPLEQTTAPVIASRTVLPLE